MAFVKNAAVTGFTFALVSKTDGSAITTGTVTGYYTLDGGTQGTIAGTPAHEGNGQWSVNLTAGEMNGDVVGLLFTHTDAIPAQFTIATLTTTEYTSLVDSGSDTYSADADLALYLRESSVLPALTNQHIEARRRIDAYLRSKGLTSTEIADLGTTTLAQLKVASCYLVLAMFFDSFVGDQGARDAAMRYEALYTATMSALYIEFTGGEEDGAVDVLAGGTCILG